MALRAAATAGIEVPVGAVNKGVGYYKSMFCPGGGFGYTSNHDPNPTRGGIGMLVMCLSGAYRSHEVKATADYLFVQDFGTERHGHFFYMCYYVSQAMRQGGGKYWRKWNESMTPVLMAMQKQDGSWADTSGTGHVLATTFALLSIEVNYDYLPIYQR